MDKGQHSAGLSVRPGQDVASELETARRFVEHLSERRCTDYLPDEVYTRVIRGLCLPAAPLRILDIGCGIGNWARRFAALGHAVWAVDISPEAIDYGKRTAPNTTGRIEWIVADLSAMDSLVIPKVDLAFGGGILHHISYAATAELASKLARMLVPNGRAAFMEWNVLSPTNIVRSVLRHWRADTGLSSNERPISPITTSRIFGALGYALEDMYAISPFEETTGRLPTVRGAFTWCAERLLRRLPWQKIDRRLAWGSHFVACFRIAS